MNEIVESTKNKRGFTYSLSFYGKAFVSFARETQFPLMDVGAAFGVASIPALENGAEVIAVDIDAQHIERLVEETPEHLVQRLKTVVGKFPYMDFPSGSIGGIYLSQVFPFLKGDEIEKGMEKMLDWLVPGGKLFIVSFTPYLKHCEAFIPIYEERKSGKVEWAGYIDNLKLYSSDPNIARHLPNEVNHIDTIDLQRVCEKYGFLIEKLELFGDPENTLPPGIKYDDRERVGLIASKPI